jgi:hypothetical protein
MLQNPFYVKPARLSSAGIITFKEAVRVYLGSLQTDLMRRHMAPSESFHPVKVTMEDFAEQMDKQAVIKLKVKK